MKPIEDDFHKDVWDLANEFSRVERGMAEARDIMYLILREEDPEVISDVADRWLDEFGRNHRVEILSQSKIERALEE